MVAGQGKRAAKLLFRSFFHPKQLSYLANMSQAAWRSHFTSVAESVLLSIRDHRFHSLKSSTIPYHLFSSLLVGINLSNSCHPSPLFSYHSFNKYTSICARATRQCLKEEERVKATKRGGLSLRYQEWKDGKAGEHVSNVMALVASVRRV